MGLSLWTLFFIALAYLGLLFLIAWCADTGLLPRRVVDHPLVYTLSLGVYATSWTFYGSVGLANASGLAFLTIYLGVTAAFMLGPYLLRPILRLCRDYQLASVADLLAFRYGGRATGFAVTLFMLIGVLPYISLQIHAVTESVQVLSRQAPPGLLALMFCSVITIFAVLFGARHLTPREKHAGLVAAIAFESAVKLIALLVAGGFVITAIFGSFGAMTDWVERHPQELQALYTPTATPLWTTLLLLSFSAAFLLPRQYHMTFVENEKPASLRTAYWLFPLYLLLLNLPIIPILWAGKHLSLPGSADFYVLAMAQTLGREWLAILIFIGGLSAASAMMIVTTLSLSYMCLNHLLLPASLSAVTPEINLYRRILWSKRLIIALIIAAGYGFYLVIEVNQGLASLGLISFVAVVQLLPGVVGLLYWPRATQTGFLLGLCGGALVWFMVLILPLLSGNATLDSVEALIAGMGYSSVDVWSFATFCTLTVNVGLFVLGSLLTTPSDEEISATDACISDTIRPPSGALVARSVDDYQAQLEGLVGREAAEQEVRSALHDLNLSGEQLQPAQLLLLHEKLERNLSGLLGPTVARLTMRGQLQVSEPSSVALTESLRFMEVRLESSRERLRGLTRELDDLRRYLRDVLRELPLGVCAIASDGTILIWNAAMERMSGVAEPQARNGTLAQLPQPWCELLQHFSASNDAHKFRQRTYIDAEPLSLNLHKSSVTLPGGEDAARHSGQVLLVEDRTSIDLLESELAHSERLASIGRLAAGVAHEIGNPLTGIASIAQNIRYEEEKHALDESATDILDQVGRINAIVKSLLTYSRHDIPEGEDRSHVDLVESIREAIQLVQLAEQRQQHKFAIHCEQPLTVFANSRQMVQVFVNLLNNACDASTPERHIDITGEAHSSGISINIRDYGEGVPEAEQLRLFEPFYTTKPAGQGTGLGLAMVYNLINQHGGRVSFDHSVTPGTQVDIWLPATAAASDTGGSAL